MTPKSVSCMSEESKQTGVLNECDAETTDGGLTFDIAERKKADSRNLQVVWRNVIFFTFTHLSAVYGVWLLFTTAKWPTVLLTACLYVAGGLGITAGVHRLWAHRAYKAKWPLRLLLVIFNASTFEDSVYDWVRDHRVHHKFSDTDADPYNASRGFFFSHVGWLMVRKHPDISAKGKTIDLSDLHDDPIVMFQKKYYWILMPLLCFILPTILPVYCWDETWKVAFFVPTMFRWCFNLNMTWCVNSVAHIFGNRPYDKHMNPVENLGVSIFAFGEGWHNYHHCFPWDYKASELGRLNFTTAFINLCAKVGLAYNLKTVSPEIVKQRIKRTGDGTHAVWGWNDKDLKADIKDKAVIFNKKLV